LKQKTQKGFLPTKVAFSWKYFQFKAEKTRKRIKKSKKR